jgi:subtilisin family serine protease
VTDPDRVRLQAAVDDAYTKGAIIVAAAGNAREYLDGIGADYYVPAELNHVISVGATNDRDGYCQPDFTGQAALSCGTGSPGSARGPLLDVMAPGGAVQGVQILVTGGPCSNCICTLKLGGGITRSFGGTSASAPFVSGLAALLLSANPSEASPQTDE